MSKSIVFTSCNIDIIINKFQKFENTNKGSRCAVCCQPIPISEGETSKSFIKYF